MQQANGPRDWLYGPAPDLLLGCGLFYVPLAIGLWLAGPGLAQAQPEWLPFLLVLVLSTPHYGATLLRVYENPADRRAYRIFSVYATLLLVAALAVAVHVPWWGSLMVTIYLTWSPWHYTGQNYGIAVMFLRRRGVEITPLAKRCLYASFILSYAMVFLVAHLDAGPSLDDALGYAAEKVIFVKLGIPASVDAVLFPALLVAHAATTLVCAIALLRRASVRAILPAAALLLTQSFWFTLPRIAYHWGLRTEFLDLTGTQFTAYYGLWIALGHAVQYLWITSYYARSERGWSGQGPYLMKTFLVGSAVWTIPPVVFGPDALGGLDYSLGLALCVSAAVNIHHFILDGAIWKLRNTRIARILIRSEPGAAEGGGDAAASSWLRRLTWGVAALGSSVALLAFSELDFLLPRALERGEYHRAAAILERAGWYGRDTAQSRADLANRLVQEGEPVAASDHFRRSLDLHPHVDGFAQLGRLYAMAGAREEALRTWERGLAVFPDAPDLLRRIGNEWLDAGDPERALSYLRRAAERKPDELRIRFSLERAERMLAEPGS